jgi:hypothetical protein
MEIINFKDSLINYKPVYYHFLDGYINKKVGNYIDKTYEFVLEHIISKNKIF